MSKASETFQIVLMMSFMLPVDEQGFSIHVLDVQGRMVLQIAAISNELVWSGSIKNHESVEVCHRPFAHIFHNISQGLDPGRGLQPLKDEPCVLFMDFEKCGYHRVETNKCGARLCDLYVITGIRLVEMLLEADTQGKAAIASLPAYSP